MLLKFLNQPQKESDLQTDLLFLLYFPISQHLCVVTQQKTKTKVKKVNKYFLIEIFTLIFFSSKWFESLDRDTRIWKTSQNLATEFSEAQSSVEAQTLPVPRQQAITVKDISREQCSFLTLHLLCTYPQEQDSKKLPCPRS